MKFNLGDYDLGDLGLGDFSLGDLGLGDFNLRDFKLGDFDLIPFSETPIFIQNYCSSDSNLIKCFESCSMNHICSVEYNTKFSSLDTVDLL